MSATEILDQLPKLAVAERAKLFARLIELQEADLIAGHVTDDDDKRQLDEALDAYASDGQAGTPWRDVVDRIRASRGL
jgi:hypothetical protein